MDYIKVYNTIIENAIEREYPDGYFEKHHIIPKAEGGKHSIDNVVALTFKEHYLCHLLLAKLFDNQIFAVEKFYDRNRGVRKELNTMPRWVRKKLHIARQSFYK